MTQLSSRIVPAINGLLTIAQTTLDVPVLDGPTAKIPTAKDFLVIGCQDLDGSGMSVAAEGAQDWAALGARDKDELFAIHNVYVAWAGNSGALSDCRTRAWTNLGLLEIALRDIPSGNFNLNGALTNPGWCAISINRILAIQSTAGPGIHVQFDVACRARI